MLDTLKTKTGDNFLLHDNGSDDPERFLIFATDLNLDTLHQYQIPATCSLRKNYEQFSQSRCIDNVRSASCTVLPALPGLFMK